MLTGVWIFVSQCIVRATVIGFCDAIGSHCSAQLPTSEIVLTDAIRLQVCFCIVIVLQGPLDICPFLYELCILMGLKFWILWFIVATSLILSFWFFFFVFLHMQLVSTLRVNPEYNLLFFNPNAKVDCDVILMLIYTVFISQLVELQMPCYCGLSCLLVLIKRK